MTQQETPGGAPTHADAVRLRLDLAYDGTSFSGWARQPALRTVQGVLEDALATVLRTAAHGEPAPHVTVAGRTDAGVHARGQVAHMDVAPHVLDAVRGRSDRTPTDALVARLAGVLPADVVVHRVAVAPLGFDARFSALRRRYAYRICDDSGARDPLSRAHVLWHRRPLDVAAMDAAARTLVGRHDFAAYCKPREGATTIRTLEEFVWERASGGAEAGLVVARVQADAFCHSMVRALVGASVAVGEGRRPVAWPAQLLAGGRRDAAAHVVAAHGLTLEEVGYPPDAELAERAARTRARREAHDVDPRPGTDGPAGCC
ncbi:tRNA pseudouridine(38-40) synthase TruA [Cellulomonas fimi]|uniref:tRNA pseudouridine synthase A n=1 Tax=Cellulomonas fimi (strain ATCC 484 / DSM 20113 / JCM 1341 / CCUG 24087 / LMG 16345 / NBRC 15513 / NCIMB 8980 / NCTC 7547 / NRS-133) TaxID=590998 RepID=F4H201_CELFA|nr:tRNA pseudouridine(38-40) synthase TruA [Cellulomonas fimi]AEE45171.1 tRNA pseudouridine synthase A [Cellulomonas fimi ATCC 484]NNH06266.1 tRNA pseudouridine(38-40) synthase TruA [Cellulomonas fimi]VEH28457.1 tRNA pseudouridine synthase A [Cellulomonas fimi]